MLLAAGANLKHKNNMNQSPIDMVSAPWRFNFGATGGVYAPTDGFPFAHLWCPPQCPQAIICDKM
jgi:hypothetical protein